jgi:hypothetical protein
MKELIKIKSRDYWFKVVGMLQQNWALIDEISGGSQRVYFVGDTSGVFDELEFTNVVAAEEALRRNGFVKYEEDPKAHQFIAKPEPPFARCPHQNGPIYSSGQYWR